LAEMLDQWEEYPEGDYTLYLGNFTRSFKSQHSTNQMFSSKCPSDQESLQFDSWVQSQKRVNANK